MKRSAFILAIATLVCVAPALAQGGGRGGRGGGGRGMMAAPENSVTWLISKKSDFNGNDEQIKALEMIAKKLDDDTKDVRACIMKLMPAPPADPANVTDEERAKMRETMMANREALMPLREEFQKKDAAAVEEALKTLKEDQVATVRKLFEDRAAAGRGRGRGSL